MPSPATPRPRLIAGGAAFVIALGLGAWPALLAPREGVVVIGATGVALFALALVVASARFVPWALGLLAAAFIVAIYVRDARFDLVAALYGAGLLLAGELADWSFELGLASRVDPGIERRRALTIAGVVAGAAVVGLVAAYAAGAPVAGGFALAAAGVGAVVALFAALVAGIWRASRVPDDDRPRG